MSVIAYDRPKPGVPMERIEQVLAEEAAVAWRPRQQRRIAASPTTQNGYAECFFVALRAPMLGTQFSDQALERAGG